MNFPFPFHRTQPSVHDILLLRSYLGPTVFKEVAGTSYTPDGLDTLPNACVKTTGGSGVAITLPKGLTPGCYIPFLQGGAGIHTIAVVAGMALMAPQGNKTSIVGAVWGAWLIDADTWHISGMLSA
jgi:hypothetical protein